MELQGLISADVHEFVPCKNEVAMLAERLRGLVFVAFKKDCLDLPDKHYRTIELKPKPSTLRAASLLIASSKTTIEGLTRLRELSDGFQYVDTKTGRATCSVCKGTASILQPVEIPNTCPNCLTAIRESKFAICGRHTPEITNELLPCPNCAGIGEVDTYERTTQELPCPKDDALDELLDEFEDIGRVVIYAGFTGSLDRVVKRVRHRGWHCIRMDQGRNPNYRC